MTKEEFNEKFNDLVMDMIQAAYDFVGGADEVDKLYVYADMEGNTYSFNFFYQINGQFVYPHQVNDFIAQQVDTSLGGAKEFFKAGTAATKGMREIFESAQDSVPSHMKFVYSIEHENFESEFSYDLHHSNTEDLLAGDIFTKWYEEVEKEHC